jgi:hypothetical protein
MEERLGITVSPSMVIGLGEFGLRIVERVRAELIEVEPKLELITGFVAVRGVGEGRIEASPLTDSPIEGECVDMPRREAFQAFKEALPQVQAQVHEALRKVRLHQSLVAVRKRPEEVGLYVYIVADLREGIPSGVILPLSYQVHGLLADQPYHSVVGLLSIANFSPPLEQSRERAMLYAALKELDYFMRMPYAKASVNELMGFPVSGPPLNRCYLFDVTKEDGSLVEGPEELRSAMSCFLLALLISSFEEEVGKRLHRLSLVERGGFYSSGGVAVLSYPVDKATIWCAAKLGKDFIEEQLLRPSRLNLSALNEEGERVGEEALSLKKWTEELINGIPARMTGERLHIELEVDRPNFGQIAKEDWADRIASFDSLFGTHRFPLYWRKLEENASQLHERVISRLSEALDSALTEARLYPSGIPGARKILEKLEETLAKRKEELEQYRVDFPLDPAGDLRALEEAALNFPPFLALLARLLLLCVLEVYLALPFLLLLGFPLLFSLPFLLPLCLLTVAGGLYWFKREDDILIQKRERCMENVGRKYSAMLESRAIAEIKEIIQEIEGWIEEMRAKLDDLWRELEEARDKLHQAMEASFAAKEPFVRSAVGEDVLRDFYLRFAPPKEALLSSLLEEEGLLDNWKDLKEETIREKLLSFGKKAFRGPLREVSLDQILRERTPPSPEERLRPLLDLAVPLLKFSLAGLGEGLSAWSGDFIALEDLSSSVLKSFISKELREVEPSSTGDRYHLFLCRTKHLLPLISIGTVVRLLKEPYQKMDEKERRVLHLFDEWADLPEPQVSVRR